jgi:hypothetical protein
MGRRPPSAVRAEQRPARKSLIAPPKVPGLSPRANEILSDLERTRGWTESVAFALSWWVNWVRHPYHRLYDRRYPGCGFAGCCPDPGELMTMLKSAAHTLPKRDAQVLRRYIRQLEDDL